MGSDSKPGGQTLCTIHTYTHQQGNGHLVGVNPRLRTRSPASCARSCRSLEECVRPGTWAPSPLCQVRNGKNPKRKPRPFLGSLIQCPPAEQQGGGVTSLCPLTACYPAEGVHPARPMQGSPLSSRGKGGAGAHGVSPALCFKLHLACQSWVTRAQWTRGIPLYLQNIKKSVCHLHI